MQRMTEMFSLCKQSSSDESGSVIFGLELARAFNFLVGSGRALSNIFRAKSGRALQIFGSGRVKLVTLSGRVGSSFCARKN